MQNDVNRPARGGFLSGFAEVAGSYGNDYSVVSWPHESMGGDVVPELAVMQYAKSVSVSPRLIERPRFVATDHRECRI